jgi:hypothetical protein
MRAVEERFLAWTDANGLLVPTSRDVRVEGEEPRTLTWDRVERLPVPPASAAPR